MKKTTLSKPCIIIFYFFCLFQVTACQAEMKSKLNGAEIVKQLAEGKTLRLTDQTIEGDLDFTTLSDVHPLSPTLATVTVSGSAIFERCTFKGKWIGFKKAVPATGTIFVGGLQFNECTFNAPIFMREGNFSSLHFNNTTFNGEVNVEGSTFNGQFVLQSCTFKDEASFQRTQFRSDFTMLEGTFEQIVSFQSARYWGETTFGKVNFKKYVDFSNMRALGGFYCNGAQSAGQFVCNNSEFLSRAEWMQGNYQGDVEMKQCIFAGRTRFEATHFHNQLNWQGSHFLCGKPALSNVQIDKSKLTLQDCVFMQANKIEPSDF